MMCNYGLIDLESCFSPAYRFGRPVQCPAAAPLALNWSLKCLSISNFLHCPSLGQVLTVISWSCGQHEALPSYCSLQHQLQYSYNNRTTPATSQPEIIWLACAAATHQAEGASAVAGLFNFKFTSSNCPVCICTYWNFWSIVARIIVHNCLYYCTYFCMYFGMYFCICTYIRTTRIYPYWYVFMGKWIHILYVYMDKLPSKFVYAQRT